ncbi:NAD(P)/FAD-dependent oxidoreductase [Jatrophihabitans sp.]|uniref:phytoene desaturase family protein n=1 Tax=Jatrophihabitans sp. TaxID=1932789 RepID=UPI0030C6B5D8|nr:dependent oxidoreductase [Jatrophihabitans sp.]
MSILTYDAIVVGAGPNGLVAALTLARRGQRVLVVEAAPRIGGGLRTEELTLPGFRHDVGATVLPLAKGSPAFRELAPELYGLRWAQPEVPLAHPLAKEATLLYRDIDATAFGLGDDGTPYRTLMRPLLDERVVDALLRPRSPAVAARALPGLARYATSGALPASLLGRLAFRDEPARALLAGLAAHAVLPLHRLTTAGVATLLAGLAHNVGWPVVVGGSEQLARALGAALLRHGAEIHVGTPVRSLAELPPARAVLLDLTPRQILDVAGERLPARYARALRRFRYGPGVFKLDWALDAPVPWRDPSVGAAGTVHLGGTAGQIAAAERAVARGRHPERPYVICVQATTADPTRAPAGKHTLWAYCHVPHGSTVDMTAAIENQLDRAAPGFRDRVLGRSVLSPAALESLDANLIGGDVGGGSADLRQLLARPALSAQPWRTPLRGLYICSASTPPGGGVHGMGGWNAAKLVLRDLA